MLKCLRDGAGGKGLLKVDLGREDVGSIFCSWKYVCVYLRIT